MARFIWENREPLGLMEGAETRVVSVNPCWRVGIDGFHLRETVAQYVQSLQIKASELGEVKVKRPDGMPPETEVTLYGGGVLVFDEHGRVKYHIHNHVNNPEEQTRRLKSLFERGYYDPEIASQRRFARLHRQRMLKMPVDAAERW